jgi:hypothetical protein
MIGPQIGAAARDLAANEVHRALLIKEAKNAAFVRKLKSSSGRGSLFGTRNWRRCTPVRTRINACAGAACCQCAFPRTRQNSRENARSVFSHYWSKGNRRMHAIDRDCWSNGAALQVLYPTPAAIIPMCVT